jgi:hypothetical protein
MVSNLLLIDIDGLRPDVFSAALHSGQLPGLSSLLGGEKHTRGLLQPALSTAPSITFTSQASLFTGAHPNQHGIPGNQFFDRFGKHNQGQPRHYAFDVGDTLEVDDAVLVFTNGLAAHCLEAPTIYEKLAASNWRSVVAGNMYASGAETWLKPSLIDLARFIKGGNLFGLSPAEFDRQTLDHLLNAIHQNGLPDLMTFYILGLDHEAHNRGPQIQLEYLTTVVDPLVHELWQTFRELQDPSRNGMPLCAIFSDHGHIAVPADDKHSLRMAFPFERELGPFFDALGLDVLDVPGENLNLDAVIASNGGIAHIYLRNRTARDWTLAPDFEGEVMPVAGALWQAHAYGRYAPELQNALAGVLVRDVEHLGWYAPYQALSLQGLRSSLVDWFADQPAESYADPVNRLNNLAGPISGDILLISNYSAGYYFSGPLRGMHGGLHPEDSFATLAFGLPDATKTEWQAARRLLQKSIQKRCQSENGRQPSTADLVTGLMALIKG